MQDIIAINNNLPNLIIILVLQHNSFLLVSICDSVIFLF